MNNLLTKQHVLPYYQHVIHCNNNNIFWSDGMLRSKGSGSNGAVLKADRIEDLIDAKNKYLELEAGAAAGRGSAAARRGASHRAAEILRV